MYRLLTVCLCLFALNSSSAQYDHIDVFEDLEGDELLNAIQNEYTVESTLSFSNGRDTLFSVVWGKNDSLECVYTGFKRYMDPNEDPTTTVFNNGTPDGINTEHSYPRSKGADEGNPRADMHHLFPTRVDVNGIRASHPFEEIPDSQTETWYYDDIKTNNIPNAATIDNYSEYRNGGFEVRASFKGNIARAVFYFYSIYREEADAADDTFFDIQKDDLCDWHFEDPVDEEEWENTFKIAKYQDDIPNPFILDCRLARLYCPEIDLACGLVSNQNIDHEMPVFYPNPSSDFIYMSPADQTIDVEVLNLNGQIILKETTREVLDVRILSPGVYILRMSNPHFSYTNRLVKN